MRQLSEPPPASAVPANQVPRQGSYFRRQASLPFPAEAQQGAAPVDGAVPVPAEQYQSERSVVERLVPDYDWEQDALSGAVFDYNFGDISGLASVVDGQVQTANFHCTLTNYNYS